MDEDRIHGVELAIKSSLMEQLPTLSIGVNERLMKLRLPLGRNRYATIISAYAPTLTSPEETIEQFSANLSSVLDSVLANDKLILLGDFNARVGRDHCRWEGVLGRHGTGNLNANGLLLLSKCTEYDLAVTNTVFKMADKYKTSWMHPRSKQSHFQIDYVIVRKRDIRDVLITRAMRGAECWTDYRLIRSTLNLIIPLCTESPQNCPENYSTLPNFSSVNILKVSSPNWTNNLLLSNYHLSSQPKNGPSLER